MYAARARSTSRGGLLAALSHAADFSLGCYCEDETRCHRSVLRAELKQRGADLVAAAR